MLFIFIMEVLGALFCKADEWAFAAGVGVHGIPFWASLYAYDVILFLSPVSGDLQITRTIFNLF
jgi:hypothetical protein